MKSTKRSLKQLIACFSIVCIVALFSSCSSKNEIVGKWKNTGSTETWEFFKDGTATWVGQGGRSMVGSYKFVDDDRVKLEMPGEEPQICKASFSGGELSLTTPDGAVRKYARFK